MNLLIWTVLFAVAVSDAKEHRIPNTLLLAVVVLVFINIVFLIQDFSLLFWSFITGITCFICALLLYFLKVMAPGDVKLLGVVGFWLGSEHITQAIFWIAVSSVVVVEALQRSSWTESNTRRWFSSRTIKVITFQI